MSDDVVTALIQALVEAPDDLATRSVLADRLLELDDPRGKMLQLDLELRRTDGFDAKRVIERQIDQILSPHRLRLAGDIATHAERFEFVGGFVDHVLATAPVFRKHGEAWFRSQPIRSFAPKPWNAAAVKTLVKSPHLGLVRTLRLGRTGPWKMGAFPIAPLATAALDRLEELDFSWSMLAGEDAERFFRELRAPRLHTLKFSSGHLDAMALRGLAANRTLCGQLRTLALAHIKPSYADTVLEPDAEAIADAAFAALDLPNLTTLDLDYAWFGTPARISTVVRATPALEFLQSSLIDDTVLDAIRGCTHVRKLYSLQKPISSASIAHLVSLPALHETVVLKDDWPAAQVDELVDALVALPTSHPLRYVHMMNAPERLTERFPPP